MFDFSIFSSNLQNLDNFELVDWGVEALLDWEHWTHGGRITPPPPADPSQCSVWHKTAHRTLQCSTFNCGSSVFCVTRPARL